LSPRALASTSLRPLKTFDGEKRCFYSLRGIRRDENIVNVTSMLAGRPTGISHLDNGYIFIVLRDAMTLCPPFSFSGFVISQLAIDLHDRIASDSDWQSSALAILGCDFGICGNFRLMFQAALLVVSLSLSHGFLRGVLIDDMRPL